MSDLVFTAVESGRTTMSMLTRRRTDEGARFLIVITGGRQIMPRLPVDPQDTEERFAALVVQGADAVVELLTFLAPVAESVRDQSVTTHSISALNHTGGNGSDLPVCPTWVAPPSGLERIRSSSGRVVTGASPSPVERESGAAIGRSWGLIRLGPQASVTNRVTTCTAAQSHSAKSFVTGRGTLTARLTSTDAPRMPRHADGTRDRHR